MKRLIGLLLFFILLLPSLSLNVMSQEKNIGKESVEESEKISLIDKLLKIRFNIGSFPGLGRYFIQQLRPPVPIQAYPESLALRYNKKIYFDIGGKDPNTGKWEKMVKVAGPWSWGWMNRVIKYSFEVVPFEDSSMDVWNIDFEPKVLELYPNRENLDWPGAETPFRTNVSIMLKPNVDPSIVTQDLVLKINIVREEALDKIAILKPVPDFVIKNKEEYIQKEEELGLSPWFYKNPGQILLYNIWTRFFLFFINCPLPIYNKWVDSTVEVLVKVNKYHLAEIEAPATSIKIEPYQVKSIPVKITNIGSHIDTYNFRVKCNEKNMVVTAPPALTLKPGEEGQALVGVAAPRSFYSPGDITSVSVEAYSVDDPETVFSNTILLKTSGVYTTGNATYTFILIIIIIILIILFYFFLLKKYKEKYGKNKSILVSFKDTTIILKKSLVKFLKLFKKLKKDKSVKEEQKVEIKKEEKIAVEKPIKIEPEKKQEPQVIEQKTPKLTTTKTQISEKEISLLRKKQATLRILKDQEKQKKKFRSKKQ